MGGATSANRPSPAEAAIAVESSVGSGPSAGEVTAWVASLLQASGRRRARLSVLLCGDRRMRTLNRVWRRRDAPTDVLSFPSGGEDGGFLGDIAIDTTYARRQACRLGHSIEREVQILLAHGLLHLLGYDHEIDDGRMFARQRALVVKAFGPGPDGVPGAKGGGA